MSGGRRSLSDARSPASLGSPEPMGFPEARSLVFLQPMVLSQAMWSPQAVELLVAGAHGSHPAHGFTGVYTTRRANRVAIACGAVVSHELGTSHPCRSCRLAIDRTVQACVEPCV